MNEATICSEEEEEEEEEVKCIDVDEDLSKLQESFSNLKIDKTKDMNENTDITEALIIFNDVYCHNESDRLIFTIYGMKRMVDCYRELLKTYSKEHLEELSKEKPLWFNQPISKWQANEFGYFTCTFFQSYYSPSISLEELSKNPIPAREDDNEKITPSKMVEGNELSKLKSEMMKIVVFLATYFQNVKNVFAECLSTKSISELLPKRNMSVEKEKKSTKIDFFIENLQSESVVSIEDKWINLYNIITEMWVASDQKFLYYSVNDIDNAAKKINEWCLNEDALSLRQTVGIPLLFSAIILRASIYNISYHNTETAKEQFKIRQNKEAIKIQREQLRDRRTRKRF
jgi:hypothetical protein